ncbi:MAG TPA: hypothetical protein ENK48_03895 [Gammaproteobacteria bacterium]|nr:hypothetical protein [Gammaproteobacteria bacterium]
MMKLASPTLLLAIAIGFMGLYTAPVAADTILRNAEADIARFEQQASGLSAARSSNVRRILKLMNLSHQRLQQYPNHDDPAWRQINQRYVSLQGQLEGLLKPQQSAQTTAPAPSQTAQPPSTAAQPGQNVAPALVSGQRVRLKKLARDINAARSRLFTTGPSRFQDPAEVAAYQKHMKQFAQALERYPQVEDPDVKQARAEYQALREALIAEFERAKKQMAQLGNVQQRLATVEANGRKYAPPRPLTLPFSETEARAWAEAASDARTVADHNLKELEAIVPLAYLPENRGTPQTGAPYDASDINRLRRHALNVRNEIENGYRLMANDLDGRLTEIDHRAASYAAQELTLDKLWKFIGDGEEVRAFAQIDEDLAVVRSALFLEQALGRDTAKASQSIARLEQAKKDFVNKRDMALESSRLPEPAAQDEERIAIARQILANPEYRFGKHGRIILTSPEIVERERKDSEIEIDDAEISLSGDLKLSGTETTWTYKWEEFKFATPLKEVDSDTWYIWWITAKKFSSGSASTPMNQWVSGKATKGNRILGKHI